MPDDNVWQAVPRFALQIDCRTIFDVGAHTGDITRRFLGELPESVVYSFEADPRNFRRLKSAFDGDERVRAVHAAVSSQPGTAAFHLGANDYTSSLFPREDEMRRYYHSQYTMVDTLTVPMITLDNFCRDYGTEQIDVLKIDTQGAELDILRGAEHILDALKNIDYSDRIFLYSALQGSTSPRRDLGVVATAQMRDLRSLQRAARIQRPD